MITEQARAAQSYRATGTHGRMVASFRLPVAAGGLTVLSDWLRKQYGDGLLMRQQGEFILIEEQRREG